MKRNFKFYIIIWAVLLAIYNLAVFLVKPIIPGYVINYDARFWVSWSIIIATYIGQLVCAKMAFDSKNIEKFFLNITLITQSYTTLIVATLAGSIFMIIPDFPTWPAAIICAAIFGFGVIAVVKAKAVAEVVGETDDKIREKISFIKTLTADVDSLLKQTADDSIKVEIKKVYEAIRYSDPMSNDRLSGIENEIALKFNTLKSLVISENSDLAIKEAAVLIALIGERNQQCKLLK